MSRILRVFPRRTSATPDDAMVWVGPPMHFAPVECDEVHISCTFTWDKPQTERLAELWREEGYSVKVGGPAYDAPAGDFVPGMYVKKGITFTSRGCIRKCPFCLVAGREGALKLLDIKPGWDLFDNNLLACPRSHIEAVLAMLEEQPRAARFTGGLDARLVEPWFVSRLAKMRLNILYTAYDIAAERPFVERAIKMLCDAGIPRHKIGCYVLVGQDGDSQNAAAERLEDVFSFGGMPFAMFYRAPSCMDSKVPVLWRPFVRSWNRPAAIMAAHTPKKKPVSLW